MHRGTISTVFYDEALRIPRHFRTLLWGQPNPSGGAGLPALEVRIEHLHPSEIELRRSRVPALEVDDGGFLP